MQATAHLARYPAGSSVGENSKHYVWLARETANGAMYKCLFRSAKKDETYCLHQHGACASNTGRAKKMLRRPTDAPERSTAAEHS